VAFERSPFRFGLYSQRSALWIVFEAEDLPWAIGEGKSQTVSGRFVNGDTMTASGNLAVIAGGTP
jgi:hypothetical protein